VIEVIAANADGTLTSRNNALARTAPGTPVMRAPTAMPSSGLPTTPGIRSNYVMPHDATAFEQAVRRGATFIRRSTHKYY